MNPSEAIIAVTYQCNSRCLMCDVWKKAIGSQQKAVVRGESHKQELAPEFYQKLPSSLKEINISGGEPFLRKDLIQIIKVLHRACPKARILISTNGFLIERIKKFTPQIIKVFPKLAIRVSLDGTGKLHDEIRGVKGGYYKAIASLYYLKGIVKDLGIGFTLMEKNKQELLKVWMLCQRNNWDFSLSLVSDSSILFGNGKFLLRPKQNYFLKNIFQQLIKKQFQSSKPKNWARGWFNQELYNYLISGKRKLSCRGGSNFIYLDSFGLVYTCHFKPWLMGNLKQKSFKKIFESSLASRLRKKTNKCQDCWLICSARSSIKSEWFKVGKEIFLNKIQSNF